MTMQNGLYSVHVDMLDGHGGRGSGVMTFIDGIIRGGDAFLFYVGTYRMIADKMRGEVVINQHTRQPDTNPLFGGREVSIGFTGTFANGRVYLSGSALVGKNSQQFKASLMRLSD